MFLYFSKIQLGKAEKHLIQQINSSIIKINVKKSLFYFSSYISLTLSPLILIISILEVFNGSN